MNVFDLDGVLVRDYERFARSFTKIRAKDIQEQVKSLYSSDRFWPDPLLSINPRFKAGDSVEQLVRGGTLHESTAQVFSLNGKGLILHRHQAQAVAKAASGQSFVVTTGTGSGKSLCFFIPIIDAAIRARFAGEAHRTRAIVIYPMNALANSIGRGTRGGADYCVVILTSDKLVGWIGRKVNLDQLTASTRAQLKMGQEVSEEVKKSTEVLQTVMKCLERDHDWVAYHASELAEAALVAPVDELALRIAGGERKAFQQQRMGQFEPSHPRQAHFGSGGRERHRTDRLALGVGGTHRISNG